MYVIFVRLYCEGASGPVRVRLEVNGWLAEASQATFLCGSFEDLKGKSLLLHLEQDDGEDQIGALLPGDAKEESDCFQLARDSLRAHLRAVARNGGSKKKVH